MDDAKKRYGSMVFGLYFGVVFIVLRLILTNRFSVSTPVAAGLAIFIAALTGYPILASCYRPRSFFNRSGKVGTLLPFIVLCAAMSFAFYLVASFFQWQ